MFLAIAARKRETPPLQCKRQSLSLASSFCTYRGGSANARYRYWGRSGPVASLYLFIILLFGTSAMFNPSLTAVRIVSCLYEGDEPLFRLENLVV